jgi:hypothetical protein
MERTIEQWKAELELEYESARFERRHLIRPLPQGHRVNDARLGMSMKEVFRRWNRVGRDPFGGKRDGFVNEVLDTYFLFTEISERLQGIVKGCRESEVPDAGATGLGFAAVGAGSNSESRCWVEV